MCCLMAHTPGLKFQKPTESGVMLTLMMLTLMQNFVLGVFDKYTTLHMLEFTASETLIDVVSVPHILVTRKVILYND